MVILIMFVKFVMLLVLSVLDLQVMNVSHAHKEDIKSNILIIFFIKFYLYDNIFLNITN